MIFYTAILIFIVTSFTAWLFSFYVARDIKKKDEALYLRLREPMSWRALYGWARVKFAFWLIRGSYKDDVSDPALVRLCAILRILYVLAYLSLLVLLVLILSPYTIDG